MSLYVSRLAVSSALLAGTALIAAQPADADLQLASVRCTNAAADVSWHREHPATSPPATVAGAMAYDATSGETIMFGGWSNGIPQDRTWSWDGLTWTELHPAVIPPYRALNVMAYDAARGEVVMFGGDHSEGAYLGDTWVFKDGEWTERHPATSPRPSSDNAMAYDPLHRQVVMFSHYSGDGDETWTWDGANWTEHQPTKSPVGVMEMAYDPARRGVVQFGSYRHDQLRRPLWIWDGTNWTWDYLRPAPRRRTLVATAQFGRNVVLFGGRYSGTQTYYNDTWVLGPCDWTRVHAAKSPDPRQSAMLAWDSDRHAAVLFGGTDGDDFYADTWILKR